MVIENVANQIFSENRDLVSVLVWGTSRFRDLEDVLNFLSFFGLRSIALTCSFGLAILWVSFANASANQT
jgi:hypothetical protein